MLGTNEWAKPALVMRRRYGRRRMVVKAALLAATVLLVATAPLWGLTVFLYVCGGLLAALFLVLAGALLNVYVGFRIFERGIDELARKYLGRPRPFLRLIANRRLW